MRVIDLISPEKLVHPNVLELMSKEKYKQGFDKVRKRLTKGAYDKDFLNSLIIDTAKLPKISCLNELIAKKNAIEQGTELYDFAPINLEYNIIKNIALKKNFYKIPILKIKEFDNAQITYEILLNFAKSGHRRYFVNNETTKTVQLIDTDFLSGMKVYFGTLKLTNSSKLEHNFENIQAKKVFEELSNSYY